MTKALKELVDLVAADTGALTATDADEDSVGWNGDGTPLPMTFGHVRRASKELEALDLSHQTHVSAAALADVAAERRRQIDIEGWTQGHDDAHSDGELARAASCYAYHGSWSASDRHKMANRVPQNWPWERTWWKPTDARRDLIKAAALIIAEIERLDRAATKE